MPTAFENQRHVEQLPCDRVLRDQCVAPPEHRVQKPVLRYHEHMSRTTSLADESPTGVDPRLREGIYSFPQAAAIVGRRGQATPQQVRRWLAVIVDPSENSSPTVRIDTVSFLDLVSLETVSRLRCQGTSLQKVRKVLEALHVTRPGLGRPLAHRSFFSDSISVWAELMDETGELVGRHPQQLALRDAVRVFADEIRFVDDTASAWDISPWVDIDPLVCFGAPVVRGTRVPVTTIIANLEVADESEVADWYELSVNQVRGVAEFAA